MYISTCSPKTIEINISFQKYFDLKKGRLMFKQEYYVQFSLESKKWEDILGFSTPEIVQHSGKEFSLSLHTCHLTHINNAYFKFWPLCTVYTKHGHRLHLEKHKQSS